MGVALSDSSFLITGGSGFVGRHLVEYFSQNGFSVVATKLSRHSVCQLPGVTWVDVNWTQADQLVSKLEAYPIHTVIHCVSQQPRFGLQIADYLSVNRGALGHLMHWMSGRLVTKLITFSSVTVYGENIPDEIREDRPKNPANDYAVSKWEGDCLTQRLAAEFGIDAICFRLPSVFGAFQGGGLVDTYFDCLSNNRVLEIYSRGELIRNLLYVEDIALACHKGVESGKSSSGFRDYLLGSSNHLSMKELADCMKAKLNSQSQIVVVDQPVPVPSNWHLNLDKIRHELGYVPQTIECGLDRYLKKMCPGIPKR